MTHVVEKGYIWLLRKRCVNEVKILREIKYNVKIEKDKAAKITDVLSNCSVGTGYCDRYRLF